MKTVQYLVISVFLLYIHVCVAYKLGVGIYDMTGPSVQTNFMGYALHMTDNGGTQQEHEGKQGNIENYNVFPKKFHVPKEWRDNEHFRFLVEHSYSVLSTEDTLAEVKYRLGELGYIGNQDRQQLRMLHDYLHYLLMDILAKNGESFITEKDIKADETLTALFNGNSPDLVIKSSKTRSRPIIVDVHIGSKSTPNKSKYNLLATYFETKIVRLNNFAEDLQLIFGADDITYIGNQLRIFQTEYYYWQACLDLETILRNDVANVAILEVDYPDDFQTKKLHFKTTLVNLQAKITESRSSL
jgi:hypothetical protein